MATKKPLTKGQIVTHFSKKFELSKNVVSTIIDEMSALAIEETKRTGSFVLPNIGKVVLAERKARVGRNPATGQQIEIPAKTVVKIRIAKAFKEAITLGKK